MYSKNGSFGEVEVVGRSYLSLEGMFGFCNTGWHKCNDKYKIDHTKSRGLDLFLVTVGGCGYLKIQNQEYDLTPGTIAFVPKESFNLYRTPKGGIWEFYWIHPIGELAENFMKTIKEHGRVLSSFEPDRNYGRLVKEIMRLSETHGLATDLEISMKISEFLHLATLDLLKEPQIQSLSQKAMNYFANHFREPITTKDIAKALYVSDAHLIRVFKKETGITPHKYLQNHRLMTAVQLLQCRTMRVEEIASEVGFSSSSHFISCFKNKFGCTPKNYEK